jgi:hypothetical protein
MQRGDEVVLSSPYGHLRLGGEGWQCEVANGTAGVIVALEGHAYVGRVPLVRFGGERGLSVLVPNHWLAPLRRDGSGA